MLSLARPTWVQQKANVSQPSPTNYSRQRLSTHVNFCSAYTPIPWLSLCCEPKERKTAESFTAWLVCQPLNSWCAAQSSSDGNPFPSPTNPFYTLMKICFTSANPTTQQHSVPQVHTTPRNSHYRTCSAEVNTGSQILPHCAKRVLRVFTKLKDIKTTMISLDVTSSYNPRSPALIIFCSFQQRNTNVSHLKPAPCSGLKKKNLAPRCPS